jgi:hypothetical protein
MDYAFGGEGTTREIPTFGVGDIPMTMTDELLAKFGYEGADPNSTAGRIAETLAGPMHDMGPGKTYDSFGDIVRDYSQANSQGLQYHKWLEYQQKTGNQGASSNIVVPVIMPSTQRSSQLGFSNLVVLAHPEDAQRIARNHPRKSPNFEPIFADSVISTTDNSHWMKQREHLVQAFMPTTSLGRIFPVSLARAKQAASKLHGMCGGGAASIDMNEFLLHEANAQVTHTGPLSSLMHSSTLKQSCVLTSRLLVFKLSCLRSLLHSPAFAPAVLGLVAVGVVRV